ncbi:MAG: OB-fold nucleic acid binding domain-containing protein, partial [Stackebrandtia sp.]
MQRWRSLDDVPADWGRCVLTIGVFDGVHRGHAQLISRAVKSAAARGVPAVLMTFDPHPMEVIRPGIERPLVVCADLERTADGSRVAVAGMVVARQRPSTANGVVFMLLEDELGTINVIVAPPVYERHRLVVRTASFVLVTGRLERRDGTLNVAASALESL